MSCRHLSMYTAAVSEDAVFHELMGCCCNLMCLSTILGLEMIHLYN